MLLYVESSAFPIHSFVLQCNAADTLARVRAHLLHILYQMGHEDHQFRMRYKGQYLRDAYTLEDYRIGDHCVLKMVPMAKKHESFTDVRAERAKLGAGQSTEVKIALIQEVALLKWRERMVAGFSGILSLNRVFTLFAALMFIWYFLSPYQPWQYGSFLPWAMLIYCLGVGVISLYTSEKCPSYTHKSGFTGPSSLWPQFFMVTFLILTVMNWGVAVFLMIRFILSILDYSCLSDESTDSCTVRGFWSYFLAIYFTLHAVYLFVIWSMGVTLLRNFRFRVGDLLEEHLVVTRDVEKVIETARNGRVKEKRQAAFELATLATTGDDSKFRIVAEGGLEVLISLGLSTDEATQEYATEAMAELLTVPAIQDTFVELGGVTTLTTLLHSRNPRLVQEAVTAISYIVADSDDNKHAVVADRGLEDLAHAVQGGTDIAKRNVAGIYLDLAFSPGVRAQMAARNSPTAALVTLCTSQDSETLRLALQALELVAIENADVILYQEELLNHLLNVPRKSSDAGIYLLAGKILLYFAESPQACEKMLVAPNLKSTLHQFTKTGDPILQKVVAKVILCTLDQRQTATRAKELNLKEVLLYIRGHAADREAWNMADAGISSLEAATFSSFAPGPDSDLGSLLSIKKPLSPFERKEVGGGEASGGSASGESESGPSVGSGQGQENASSSRGSQQSLRAAEERPASAASKSSSSSSSSSSSNKSEKSKKKK